MYEREQTVRRPATATVSTPAPLRFQHRSGFREGQAKNTLHQNAYLNRGHPQIL